MQDFCFKSTEEAFIIAFLDSLGLCIKMEDGSLRPQGDYLFVGRIVSVPATFDPNDSMQELTPAEYFDGVYAIYRVSNATAELIAAAPTQEGVEIVAPPQNMTSFGGEWLSPTISDLIKERQREVDKKRDLILSNGFQFTFNEINLTLQTRDNDDRINWLGVLNAATAMILGGNGSTKTRIRTLENETIDLSFAEAQILMLQTLDYQSAVYKAAWDHKDALKVINNKKVIANYDITTNWPN